MEGLEIVFGGVFWLVGWMIRVMLKWIVVPGMSLIALAGAGEMILARTTGYNPIGTARMEAVVAQLPQISMDWTMIVAMLTAFGVMLLLVAPILGMMYIVSRTNTSLYAHC